MKKYAHLFIGFLISIICCFSTVKLSGQCISGNCLNGTGVMVFQDGSRYIGQFKNGNRHGFGTHIYQDSSTYQGQWQDGLQNGNGTRLFKDGTSQNGIWKDGKLVNLVNQDFLEGKAEPFSRKTLGCIQGDCTNGEGIYVLNSGAIYIGTFKNGEIHGVGLCMYPDGSKYQGEWKNRFPEGNGTMTYADETSRTGLWEKGVAINEMGNIIKFTTKDNGQSNTETLEIQSGCLIGNCINGRGTRAFSDGSRYEGQFKNNKPDGYGSLYYVNGSKYTGEFKNGKLHGKGVLYQSNGGTKTGEWFFGKYFGENSNITRNEAMLGCLNGNCINGYGTYVFKDGSRYTGTFKNQLADGYGKVQYKNGDRYEGEMEQGAFNGLGTLFKQGRLIKGRWEKGMYLGQENTSDNRRVSSNNGRKIKVWALIVGIATYDHMPTLNYTDDDAYRFFAFLKSPEGGALNDEHIKILIDEAATKDNIINVASDIFSKAGPEDVVIFYFSGHGLKGSFLPIDFNGYNNKLFHSEIRALLDNCRAKLKLCIADACHSGSLLAMRSGSVGNELESYYDKLAESKGGTVLLMSSKSEETSLESSGLRQGVFSHFLIRGLKGEADIDNDQYVEVQELFEFIKNNVRSYTGNRQDPMMKGQYDPETPLSWSY